MVAAVREPLTAREVRRLVYARLPLWGEAQRHGWLPGRGDGIPSGNAPDSRLPAPDWLFDLSRAFASLSPTGPAPRGFRFATLARRSLSDQQRAVYLYYVPGLLPDDTGPDTRVADAQQWQHQRDKLLHLAVRAHDSKRDALVAKAMHVDTWKARRLRANAVWLMATLVGWGRE